MSHMDDGGAIELVPRNTQPVVGGPVPPNSDLVSNPAPPSTPPPALNPITNLLLTGSSSNALPVLASNTIPSPLSDSSLHQAQPLASNPLPAPNVVQDPPLASNPIPAPNSFIPYPSPTALPIQPPNDPNTTTNSPPPQTTFITPTPAQTTISTNTTQPTTSRPNGPSRPPTSQGHLNLTFDDLIKSTSIYLPALIAVLLTFLITYLGLSSPLLWSPLAHISAPLGVLVLSILSKATDYAFVAAAQVAWDSVLWGSLMQRGHKFGQRLGRGETLVSFFVLVAGWGAWVRVLAYGWLPKWLGGGGSELKGHPKLWSLLRIFVWCGLQFPGIIILAVVNTTTSYSAVEWTDIGAGIGVFNSSLALSYPSNPLLPSYITGILKDPRVSFSVPAVTPECRNAGSSCTGYLLSGGLSSVNPGPFHISNDSSLSSYIVAFAPSYQLDVWDAPLYNISWGTDACKLYASTANTAIELCSSLYVSGGSILVAGWRPCLGELLPSGNCSVPFEDYVYRSTFIALYRRPATFAASRSSGAILSVESLGVPVVQSIAPEDFTTAIDIMLWPWDSGNYPQLCQIKSQQAGLTDLLWNFLSQSLEYDYAASSQPLDYLRNLFGTALYLFNDVSAFASTSGNVTMKDLLPDENKVRGSMARVVQHTVPAAWTIYAFVGAAGALLTAVFAALALTAVYDVPKTSAFPFVDFLGLKWKSTHPSDTNEIEEGEDLKAVFNGRKMGDDMDVLRKAAGVTVWEKADIVTTT